MYGHICLWKAGLIVILSLWPVWAEEYCNLETFKAICPPGNVVLISKAKYGRMKLGRCLTRDYYVGCNDDVTPILHEMCSGKPTCEVSIPNTALYNNQNCPKDLVSYLEVDYSCLKVSDYTNTTCRDGKALVRIGEEGGFLSANPTKLSTDSSQRISSYIRCPIVLQAPQGQKINITLYEFPSGNNPILTNHGQQYQCLKFATIKEKSGQNIRDNVICGTGRHRQELVYSSRANQITIELYRLRQQNDEGHQFLLQYQAVGCRDPDLADDMTLTRHGDQLDVRCNYTGQVWHLVCRGNNWVGQFGNCTTDLSDIYLNDGNGPTSSLGFPNGIVMAIIVGIVLGVMIGFCLLLVVYNIRRKRRKQAKGRAGHGGQGQMSGKLSDVNSGVNDPMLPFGTNPDITMDKGCHIICDVTGSVVPRGRERDHVYEKPQAGMEVQCLLSSGQNKNLAIEDDTLMLKALESGDYGCHFHTLKPWHTPQTERADITSIKCPLPT